MYIFFNFLSGPGGSDCNLWKEYGCNLQDTFMLFGWAFGITCVRYELMAQL